MGDVPNELIARHLIAEALENSVYGDVHDTAHEGRHGRHEHDTEWSLNDMDPASCEVDMDGNEVVIGDRIDGTYSVQVSRGSRMHPPEYETRTVPLYVEIRQDLTEPRLPVINVRSD